MELIVFIAETGAAEGPLLWRFRQTRFDWIRFDVMHHFAEMQFVPDVAIPIVVLPEFAASPEQAIDAARGVAFPILDEFRLRRLPDFNQ